MKQFLAVLALAGTSLVLGQTITQAERDFAVSNLQASRKKFLDSIAGLSEAQWKFKPAPDRWSVAECAEHIALSELMIMQLVTERILKAEPMPKKTQDDLRGHSIEHPLLNQLDAYQWILLIAAHSERHTAQIEEVKASPGFPGA